MQNSSNFYAKSLQEKYVRIFKGNFVADKIKSYARNLLTLKTILIEIHQPSLSYIYHCTPDNVLPFRLCIIITGAES